MHAEQIVSGLDLNPKLWEAGVLIIPNTTFSDTNLFTIYSTAQPATQWVRGIFTLGVKRQGLEAGYSPPSLTSVNFQRNTRHYIPKDSSKFSLLFTCVYKRN
jgi:hypothetical protein